jgi:radical SAM protein with 4Fe4S-binding SPASM domain
MIKEFFQRFRNSKAESDKKDYPKATVDAETIREYNQLRRPNSGASFCNAPGVNMLFGQDGKIRACCHNMEYSLGEYPKQSIAEIWNGDAAKQLHEHLKNYDLSHGCEICQADMDTQSFEEVRARHFDSLPRSAEYPTMMEFLMTNTCNLECVMCKGEYSSLIRKNRDKLPPIVSPYDQNFLQQLEDFIPHLRETRFSGSGEAFAIDMNYEIWEMIIRINPKCVIMVQTNGSYLNARIKDLLSRGNFRIGVSLDSLQKENYESIRLNANYEKVMDNIHYFSEYSSNKKEKFAVALCVMRQNWRELPEFIKFCNTNNAVATLHKVWFPVEYALHNLRYKKISEVYNYLSSFDLEAKNPLEQLNKRHFQYFVSSIKSWQENALRLRNEAIYVDSLGEDKLMPFLQSKLKKQLEVESANRKDIAGIVQVCSDKIAGVLSSYGQGHEQLSIMKQMCIVPAADSLKALRLTPIEVLTQQAKIFLVTDISEITNG